jgi:hypothetical protein
MFERSLAHLHYNLYYQYAPRLSALPHCPFYHSASVGRGLTGRSLGRSLLGNAVRMRLVRLAAGWGQPPAAASNLSIKKRAVVRSAYTMLKHYI